jgi:hypothetical protein
MSQDINEAPFVDSEALSAPAPIANSDLVVMKFGGTSVSSVESWKKISALLRNRLESGLRPVVVHSAIDKVTRDLEQILQTAVSSDPAELIVALRQQHYSLAAELGLDGPALLDGSARASGGGYPAGKGSQSAYPCARRGPGRVDGDGTGRGLSPECRL